MKLAQEKLLIDLMRLAPFQPATNLWRAVELTFLIDHALPLLKDTKEGLDLGCGDGHVMEILRSYLPENVRLNGIDIDRAETDLAEQTGLYHKVECTGGEKLSFFDATQDFVISNSVLEHVQPIHEVLREAGRVLKSHGYFIATVPSTGFHDCLKGSWNPFATKEDYNQHIDQRLAHLRYWSEEEWRKTLEEVGIKLESFVFYLTQKETQRWEWLSRLTGGLFYSLFGGRRHPILIQRSMGMRKGTKLPKALAFILTKLCSIGLKETKSNCYGCVLVIGRKI